MRKAIGFPLALAATGMVAFAVFPLGCNDNEEVAGEETPTFRIVPDAAAFNLWSNADQTPIVLEVEGGTPPFTWSLSSTNMGSIGGTNQVEGRLITYVPNADAEGVNRLEVVDSNGWIAHGTVVQDTFSIGVEGASDSSPTSVTLTNLNQVVELWVAGGIAPIGWDVSPPSLGAVSPTNGRRTFYRRNVAAEGVNTVTARDSRGLTVTASVLQHN